MIYYNNFWGMDLIWWCLWCAVLFWIFALPYNIPGQRFKKESPLANLHRRLATGEIGPEEFHRRKNLIEINAIGHS